MFPSGPHAAGERSRFGAQTLRLVGREIALGLIIHVSVVPDRPAEPFLGLLVAGCAAAWSAGDGLLSHRPVRTRKWVVIETVLLTGCAILVARLLQATFGPAPIGW